MNCQTLKRRIERKRKELDQMFRSSSETGLTTGAIYRKSCELDRLIVTYMRLNQQLELDFPDYQPWPLCR
ncbi:aspartyl-phosphate phosphatase Spo0E family protein [Heliophilum fasciatum]|uniref:Spo0E like sporulation regulatory protein n=1 Tax=Heliophilum fasciatum TaxID=35700 RepID=A0A4R2RMX6_9FIRM|nr:aspartyl-phosphate phosphatase Spo0E family protein [Heliophilum fasciatum]MCW2278062.1 hypothetical protein [Heliophilum fasciatum]TCP64318.1 Spo0E like sporulation regulatory protein [Heliophilum fasciatum]